MQPVTHPGRAVPADADEVPLNDVALGPVVQFDAFRVTADHIAPYAVVITSRDLDARELIAERDVAGAIDADEAIGHNVCLGGGIQSTDDMDAVLQIARDNVA